MLDIDVVPELQPLEVNLWLVKKEDGTGAFVLTFERSKHRNTP